jgi:hypothetical protein
VAQRDLIDCLLVTANSDAAAAYLPLAEQPDAAGSASDGESVDLTAAGR